MEFLPAPDPLDRPRGELHVWSIDLSHESPPRRRATSNAALRQVLAAYLRLDPGQVEIVNGEHGKPKLASGAGPEFNLSHSGEIALVAVSDEHRVGVDVEQVQPDRNPVALAERVFRAEDVDAVREAPPRERSSVFHQRWARHEARLKCLGIGIFRPSLPECGTVAMEDLEMPPGYAAAVAVAAAELPPLRCWTADPAASKRGEPG